MMTEEYPITTHPDGKQFIRIEDKWMPLDEMIEIYSDALRHMEGIRMAYDRFIHDWSGVKVTQSS